MTTLIIVESPAKSKTINKYLGSDYIVLPSFGHMFDLQSSKKYPWGVDVKDNFRAEYDVLPDKVNQLKTIRAAANKADLILIASDPDREGEAIAWHLAEALKDTGKPIKRVLFHEITKKSILESVKKPREIDKNLFHAQQARRIIDRIVGYSVSNFLKFTKLSEHTVSAGRVQSVALKLIGEREYEIQSFKPETYFTVSAILDKDGKLFEAKYSGKINDEDTANKILTSVKTGLTISDLEISKKTKNPPPPFDTASLAANSSAVLGFNSAKTMQIAQSLYEKGLITYMRTDSFRISDDAIIQARDLLKEFTYKIPGKPNVYGASAGAQDAHEAIRPTDCFQKPETLYASVDEKKLYELIWKRFLACQMTPAIYDATTISYKTKDNYEFKTHGRILNDPGWLNIMQDIEDKSKDIELPSMSKKEKFIPIEAATAKKQTKPPSRFTEKTLIEELKKRGIGRPSTYATILSKIQEREYVEKKKESFVPTEIGLKVLEELNPHFSFMNYDYTANMEVNLDHIGAGEISYVDMMADFYSDFDEELKTAKNSFRRKSDIVCANCGKETFKITKDQISYIYCIDFPDCKFKTTLLNKDNVIVQGELDPFTPNRDCNKCSAFMRAINSKFGWFISCTRFPDCDGKAYPTDKQRDFLNYQLSKRKVSK